MYLKTKGLVLRTTEYKDTDTILTVLTTDRGLMTVKARGVRRNASNLKSACQLLSYSEFTLMDVRGYYTVTEAVSLEMFQGLRKDIELLSLASYFAQLAEVLSQEDLPQPALLSLTLNACYAISALQKDQALVKAAFELRLAAIAGYEPQTDGCSVCGRPEVSFFSVRGGALLCSGCNDGQGLRLPVSAGSLAAMRYILYAEDKRVFSFRLEGSAKKELCDIAETYLLTQLERGFYTLDFYKSLMIGQENIK